MFAKLKRLLFTESRNHYPDFMIVGAQKAGTTALYEYLSKHPQIQPTKVKELHYFNCESRYKNGIEFYRSLFQLESGSKLLFDASPGYLHNANAPNRVHAHNPDVKIIIILREPVERAYSAWNMYRKRFMNNRNWFYEDWVAFCGDPDNSILRRQDDHIFNFFQYVTDEIELQVSIGSSAVLEAPILSHGLYYDQIKKYMSLFDRRQILVLENTELRMNTVKCLQQIETFLGIPGFDWGDLNLSPIFEGEYSESIEVADRRFLYDYYASSNERIFKLLGRRYAWGVK